MRGSRGSLGLVLGLALAGAAGAHIKMGSLSVKAGTVYTVGQKVVLSWAASIDHNKSSYNLWYSPDAGKTWTSLKTGIPGAANNVAMTYEWTVPDAPTKTGMIRVFQTFGGTVSSDPARPGDYTLFSPTFEIAASTSIAPRAAEGGLLRQVGSDLVLERAALDGASSLVLEIVGLDGAVERTLRVDVPDAEAPRLRIPLGKPEASRRRLVRVFAEGRILAQHPLAPGF